MGCTAQAGIAQATFQCSGDAHFPTANSLVSKGFARATSTDVHRRRCSSHEPPSIHPFLYTFRTHTAPLLRRPTNSEFEYHHLDAYEFPEGGDFSYDALKAL